MNRASIDLKKLTPFFGLVGVVLVTTIVSGGQNLTSVNLGYIVNQSVPLIISGLGVLFVISQGSLDLTQGALLVIAPLLGYFAGISVHSSLFIPVTIIAAGSIGLMTGTIFADLRVTSFVLTLSLSFVLRNIARWLFRFVPNDGIVFIDPTYFELDRLIFKLPITLVIIALAVYLFNYSPAGHFSKAIGSNEVVAKYSGIPVRFWKRMAFVFAGLAAGVSSLFSAVRIGTITMNSGVFFEFDVLIAILLGGTPLTGGSNSKVSGVIVGALTIAALNNGLAIVGVPAVYRALVKGFLLLSVVAVSFEREKVVYIR